MSTKWFRGFRGSRLTLRTRLVLLHGGLFLAAAVVVLALTWLLLRQRLDATAATFNAQVPQPGAIADRGVLVYANGQGLDAAQLPEWFTQHQDQLRRTALSSLLTRGGLVFVAVGTAALAVGWLLAGRILAPLHRVTDTARRIAAAPAVDHGLRERISLTGPADEVKQLADAFDVMLERLDRSFDGQRRFVANASHELRTPLATTRGVVELAMRRHRGAPDFRELGVALLEINARQERLIEGLLVLARTEHEITNRAPVDLAAVVGKVVAANTAEAATAGVTVHLSAAPATTAGDPVLIERVAQNVVQNAIRHNIPDGGWVRVTTRQAPGGPAELIVANTGPAVSEEEIPGLFEPFRRSGASRLATTGGSGLGLSIVRSITRAHAGTVAAAPNAGGGLTIHISLPRQP